MSAVSLLCVESVVFVGSSSVKFLSNARKQPFKLLDPTDDYTLGIGPNALRGSAEYILPSLIRVSPSEDAFYCSVPRFSVYRHNRHVASLVPHSTQFVTPSDIFPELAQAHGYLFGVYDVTPAGNVKFVPYTDIAVKPLGNAESIPPLPYHRLSRSNSSIRSFKPSHTPTSSGITVDYSTPGRYLVLLTKSGHLQRVYARLSYVPTEF